MSKNFMAGGAIALVCVIGVTVFMRYESRKNREAIQVAADAASKEVRVGLEEASSDVRQSIKEGIRDGIRDGIKEGIKVAMEEAPDKVIKMAPDVLKEVPKVLIGAGWDIVFGKDGKDGNQNDKTVPKSNLFPIDLGDADKLLRVPFLDPGSILDPDNIPEAWRFLFENIIDNADRFGQRMAGISVKEEEGFGAAVHRQVQKDYKLLDTPAWQKFRADMAQLAQPLVAKCKRKGLTYRFFVVDDPNFNAFSHMGGYIYVNKGLLEYLSKNESDTARRNAALQSLLGHEIAHVELEHCIRQLKYVKAAGQLPVPGNLGEQVVAGAYKLISLGYSEKQEFECDEWAYDTQGSLGVSKEDRLIFPGLLLKYAKSRGVHIEKPASDPLSQTMHDHWRTHPPAQERYDRLKAKN